MSANRDELHDLIDGLPDDQIAAVLADVKRRTAPRPPRTAEPFNWFGMIDNPDVPRDLSENLDRYMEGFGAARS
ncbi:hypothetical protein RB608_27480 [Nocardioides sp. LHD-245]|uniref:hypothetical protein n=1 Tax=Nocardioides sp. LHD-245 TaxID=3051387 RepID=UPI0027E1ADA7|nr:hypothetical protein [Nocardioides sp. LHD-245]